MQAAIIDRVLRTFTLIPQALAPSDERDAPRDEATAFATRLLDNYKGQLAQRVTRVD